MIQDRITPTLAACLAALLLCGAGCLQGSYFMKVTTADGVTIDVPVEKTAIRVADEAIAVKGLQFAPSTAEDDKGITYSFDLEFLNGSRPAEIAVDDVTDEPIMRLYTDSAPKLTGGAHWVASTSPFNAADEHVKWIMTLDSGPRVYRFTVRLADGSTHVLRYPVIVSNTTKESDRDALGIK